MTVPSREERLARLRAPGSLQQPVLGLMLRHGWSQALRTHPRASCLSWLEVYPENYVRKGRRILAELAALAEQFPLSSHGVHLSLGGADPLQSSYLDEVGAFLDRFEIPWWSDHAGASIHQGEILHEIFPVPFSAASAQHMARRVREARSATARPLLVENTAYYVVVPGSRWTEGEFLTEVISLADGELLLDINNCFVNACNFGRDPERLLEELPLSRVREIHIGGFTVDAGTGLLIDSHAACPAAPVLRLLTKALRVTGPKPVLLEWESSFSGLDQVFDAVDLVMQACANAMVDGGQA